MDRWGDSGFGAFARVSFYIYRKYCNNIVIWNILVAKKREKKNIKSRLWCWEFLYVSQSWWIWIQRLIRYDRQYFTTFISTLTVFLLSVSSTFPQFAHCECFWFAIFVHVRGIYFDERLFHWLLHYFWSDRASNQCMLIWDF